jgi:hypothetical protein
MRFNKYASFGVIPPVTRQFPEHPLLPTLKGLRDGVKASNTNAALGGLQTSIHNNTTQLAAIHDSILKLVAATQAAQHPEVDEVPSVIAWEIVACLTQVRNALCDQNEATVATVNAMLEKAANSAAARKSQQALRTVEDDGRLMSSSKRSATRRTSKGAGVFAWPS